MLVVLQVVVSELPNSYDDPELGDPTVIVELELSSPELELSSPPSPLSSLLPALSSLLPAPSSVLPEVSSSLFTLNASPTYAVGAWLWGGQT